MNIRKLAQKLSKLTSAALIGALLASNFTSYSLLTNPKNAYAAASYTVNLGVDKAQAARGEQVTYTMVVTNNGDTGLSNVNIYEASRPGYTTYVNGSSVVTKNGNNTTIADAWYSDAGGTNLGALTPGQSLTFRWAVSVNNDAPQTQSLENVVNIKTAELQTPQVYSVSFTVAINQSRNSICATKTVDKSNANVGDTVTYTIRVCNDGDIDQDNVTLYDRLPSQLTYKTGTTRATMGSSTVTVNDNWIGSTSGGSGTGYNMGRLSPTQFVVVTFQATVNSTATEGQVVENFAQVNSTQHPDIVSCAVPLTAHVPVVCTGSIGDFVWNDVNKNGIQDSGEAGIAGVAVTLRNAGGTVLATVTTDANGAYHFNNLCAATYTVTVTAPTGYTATTVNASGSTTSNDSNPNPSTVVLTANNSVDNTIDFGFFQNATCTGSIGDFVWNDTNGNGIQDSGEAGISGVTVSLKSAGGTLLSTTTTDGSGIYHFNNLCAATYIVEVSTPSGYTATTVNASGSTTSNDSNPNPSTVVLTANNSVDNTIDFGFKQNSTPGSANCSLTKKIRLPNGNERGSVGASDHVYAPGEQIIYRLFISNPGNADASPVSISDLLPPYLTWVSGDGGYASAENKVNFDLGTLKAGESRTLTYNVKVRSEIPSGQVNQVNNAKVTSPASFNNCTSTSTLVIGKPGAILAATALPQTGTIPPSILATLGLVLSGFAIRLRKTKVYKYWNK